MAADASPRLALGKASSDFSSGWVNGSVALDERCVLVILRGVAAALGRGRFRESVVGSKLGRHLAVVTLKSVGRVVQNGATVQIKVATMWMHVALQRPPPAGSDAVVSKLGKFRPANRPCTVYQATRKQYGSCGVPYCRVPESLGS